MKKVVILSVLTLWSAVFSIAWSQTFETPETLEIAHIKVSGASNTDEAFILATAGLKVGQTIQLPSFKTAKVIRNLMQTQLFEDARLREYKRIEALTFLEIEVKELPQLAKFELIGIQKKKDKEALLPILEKIAPIHAAFTPHLQQLAEEKVLEYFEEKGYANAKVELTLVPFLKQSNKVKCKVKVSQLEKIRTAKIVFSGNDHVSSAALKKANTTNQSTSRLLGDAPFLAENFAQDQQQILTYYRSLGYRDAAITDVKNVVDKKGTRHLLISISEGNLYHFGNIHFHGNSVYDDALLHTILNIQEGDIYNETKLQQQLHFSENGLDISSLYLDNGFLFFQLNPVETALHNDIIDLEIQIIEGQKARIGKVTISGNDKTTEAVIRRELRTLPGEAFSRANIIRSQRALANMGYFNIETLDVKTTIHAKEGIIDIEYVVEENNNDRLELSANWQPGIDDESGRLVGTAGVSFNNFSMQKLLKGETPFGDGQQVGIRLQSSGLAYQAANISFTEPWLGGKKPQYLSAAVHYSRYTSDNLTEQLERASLSIAGASIGLSTRLNSIDDYLNASTTLAYENIHLDEFTSITLEDGSKVSKGIFNNLYLQQSFTRNSTDHPFFPRRGANVSLSLQATAPYSLLSDNASTEWLEYHKWRIGGDFYIPLGKKAVLRASAKAGYLGKYNTSATRSPFERFFLDGDALSGQGNSITGNDFIYLRGYDQAEFEATQNGGAALFNKVTAELRYPFVNSPSMSTYGMLFAEAGNAWNDFSTYNPLEVKRSVGLGLRMQVPMLGLVGFDYSLGLNSEYFDQSTWWKSGKFSVIFGFEPD